MLGMQFIKVDPSVFLMQYRAGKPVRKGTGLSFFYFAPTTSLVAVPVGSTDLPFIFKEVTSDFQEITVQGQVVYRVENPELMAQMLNFTLDAEKQNYVSEDPNKFPGRIVNQVQVLLRAELQGLALRDVLKSSDSLVGRVREALGKAKPITSLGIEILDFSIIAIKPMPESARALEAGIREQAPEGSGPGDLRPEKRGDRAERAIKENELSTEVAVENKRRQIREAQMDAERAVQEKQRLLKDEDLAGRIALEEKNKDLVQLSAENARVEADAKAYSMAALMESIAKTDPKVLNALASMGMQPNQLIAASFRDLAGSAAKIGELNISPDLLRELTKQGR